MARPKARDARICALLCWYDESPLWLAMTIASLAGVAEHVVAVDGAYALFPKARARSAVVQQEAIVQAAAGARIGLTLHVPARPWAGNEVEKRNTSLALARSIAGQGWWLLVIDADEAIVEVSPTLRRRLAGCEERVAAYGLLERIDPQADPAIAERAMADLWQKASVRPRRCLYRYDPSLRYERAHYIVCVAGPAGPLYLWGNERLHELEPALDLEAELVVEHRLGQRDLERAEQARAYYRLRDERRVETLRSR